MRDPADLLLDHIPFMRRFARALTGSARAGDRLVTTVVERVLADTVFPPTTSELEVRTELYRRMVSHHGDRGTARSDSHDELHPLEVALDRLEEPQRRAYLLSTLETLRPASAAFVLGCDEEQLRGWLDEARQRLGEALRAHVLIVEDDVVIARDLAETVAAMGHDVSGIASTPDEAIAVANDEPITLALLDLHLAHGTDGKQTLRRLRSRVKSLPVIFVTAFAEELERDGQLAVEPIIRKPFTREQIEAAITRAVFAPRAG